MDDLTLSELRVLVAVERERGFSSAAMDLGLTQSAVSHAVRAAERKIGTVLFQRGRHGAAPTPAGEVVAGHARRVLRMLEVMKAEAYGASGGPVTGTIRLAAFRSAAFHLLPTALARFGARHPKVTVDVRIVRDIGRGIAGEVLDGRADIGVTTLPVHVDGLVVKELFAEPYVFAYPAGHPDPRCLPIIDWHENCSAETSRWWKRQEWLPAGQMTVEDDGVLVSMVGHGLGAAIVPLLSLIGCSAKVATEELGSEPPMRSVGYVTTGEMTGWSVLRDLIAELRAMRGS
ncbi:LysR family transcriptional regulator [Nonomuraea sp. NPDC049152]|uniref:LysR family transcriptional regulator n=1 Tax=Nonomuraea sp. NPDC049152 TaxID=3154350 RepID=UPI0033BFFCB6